MALPKVGVQAVVDNLDGYQNGIKAIESANQRAADSVNKTAQSFNQAEQSTSHLGNAFDVAFGNIIASAVSTATSAIGNFISGTIEAGRQGILVENQLNAVLKSTKGAAGVTAKDVLKLSDALSDSTKFTDDQVTSAQNMLLTFTQIKRDVFPQATKTVLDMSQALGQDLKSSAVQLGKALNDPVQGISALHRVGVEFSAQQKQMIANFVATGQTAKAQEVILQELQTEFGGSAEAAATPWDKLNNKLQKFQQALGEAFIPAIDGAVSALMPFIQQGLKGVSDFLTNELAPAFAKTSNVVDDFFVFMNKGRLGPIQALGEALIQQFQSGFIHDIGKALVNIGPIVDGLGKKVREMVDGGFKLLGDWWKTNGPAIQNAAVKVFGALVTMWQHIITVVGPLLQQALGKIGDWFQSSGPLITQIINNIADFFSNVLAPAIAKAWDFIGPALSGILDTVLQLASVVLNVLAGNWDKAWTQLQDIVGRAVDGIGQFLGNLLQAGAQLIQNLVQGILQGAPGVLSALGKAVQDGLAAVGDKIGEFVAKGSEMIANLVLGIINAAPISPKLKEAIINGLAAIGELEATFVQKGGELISNIVAGITQHGPEILQGISQAINDAVSAIGGLLAPFISQGSEIVNNVANGIGSNNGILNAITGAISNAATAVENALADFINTGAEIINNIVSGINSGQDFGAILQSYVQKGVSAIGGILGNFITQGQAIIDSLIAGVLKAPGAIASKISGMVTDAVTAAQGLAGKFVEIGAQMIAGLVAGIVEHAGEVAAAVVAAAKNAIGAALSVLHIGSPSKVFMEIGGHMMTGWEKGITANVSLPSVAIASASSDVIGAAGGGSYSDNSSRTNVYNLGYTPYSSEGDSSGLAAWR